MIANIRNGNESLIHNSNRFTLCLPYFHLICFLQNYHSTLSPFLTQI